MRGHNYSGYTNGCRCDVCKAAKRDYMHKRRVAAAALARQHTVSSTGGRPTYGTAFAPGATRHLADIERHGTRYGYEEAGCRCYPCTNAHNSAPRRSVA